MKFVIALVSYLESLGYDTSSLRKSADGSKAIVHMQYAEILSKNLDTNANVTIYDRVNPDFQALLASDEWNGNVTGTPNSFGDLAELAKYEARLTAQVTEAKTDMDNFQTEIAGEVTTAKEDLNAIVDNYQVTVNQQLEQTQSQFNQAVGAVTEDSEVVLARNEYTTLKERLDAEWDNVNAQLAEKVKPEKTTFFQQGKNLFDKSKAVIGYSVLGSTGSLTTNTNFATSDYITVLPNATYTRSHNHTMAFYDTNKIFISGFGSADNVYTFTTPSNAAYVRISFNKAFLESIQLEQGNASTIYENYKFEMIGEIPDKSITPLKASFFKLGKNLFDKDKVTLNRAIDSASGNVVTFTNYFASDYIPVDPNTTYTRSHEHSLAFYDSNKIFISGIGGAADVYTFTTPSNAAYVRMACPTININELQLEIGSRTTDYERHGLVIDSESLPSEVKKTPKFVAEFSTVKTPYDLSNNNNASLALIATKKTQYDNCPPDTLGYLYLDISTQKIYYSAGVADRPVFLCDWNSALSGGVACENYQATITNDGDIIFMRNWQRANPIIYPSGGYNNPTLIDFGTNLKPICWLTSTGVEHHPQNDYFVFGEYKDHSLMDEQNNDPRIIWKVSKPYNNPLSWENKKSFKHVYYESPVSTDPENEIGHIHTIVRDFYSGAWYCSTGDVDRHCRVWESLDEAETWHEVAVFGQKWRALGMIFLPDGAYWGTDAHYYQHELYKVDRNQVTGVLDFTTAQMLTKLDLLTITGTQPTYANCLLREPYGILFLDRAEPRTDNLLDLNFWSFKYNKLFKVGTYSRVANASEKVDRHGFGNQVVTTYQPTSENGIIAGDGTIARQMTLDLLNHRTSNPLGNIKITIKEK